MKKIILLILLLAASASAYRLHVVYSVGSGIGCTGVRTVITRGNGNTVSSVKDSTITTTINASITNVEKNWYLPDSLVAYSVTKMYFCGADTFIETVDNVLPIEFEQLMRGQLALANTGVQAVRDSMDEASASGSGQSFGDTLTRIYSATAAIRDSMDEASQVGSGGSGGGCPDSVGNAWTIVAWDSVNNAAVTSATITLKPSLSSSTILAQTNGSPFTFTAANGTYYVVTEANTVTFPVRSFTISGARTDTVKGGGLTVTATSNPGMATIFGVIDRNGSPAVGVWVDLVLTRPDTLTIDTSFIELRTRVVTNASGIWQADVYYLSGSTRNFYYSYKDAYGRVLYFRPTAAGSYNVREILVDKP